MPTFIEKQKTFFKRKKDLTERATPSELLFKSKLEAAGIKFKFQKGFLVGDFYCITDFYLPRPFGLAIEIDGGYHDTEKQKRADWAKDKYLTGRGIKVLRIRNENVASFDVTQLSELYLRKQSKK